MKHAHTAGGWYCLRGMIYSKGPRHGVTAPGADMRVADVRGWGYLTGGGAAHLRESEAIVIQDANGELLALAPTAPHDCDIPGCPGAENKRKLEAAGELLEALPQVLYALTESERALRAWANPSKGMGHNIILEDRGRTALALREIAKARGSIEAKAQDAKVGK